MLRLVLAVLAGFLIGTAVYGFGDELGRDSRTSVGPPQCVRFEEDGDRVVAETENMRFAGIIEANGGRGVVYRSRANAQSDYEVEGRLLPANCQLGFVNFCIGQPLQDFTDLNGPWDQQWFLLPDGQGFLHGGVVQEFPPGTIGREPVNCEEEGGEPEPLSIRLAEAINGPVTGTVPLKLIAPNAINVGVAVYRLGEDNEPEWQRVGFDGVGAPEDVGGEEFAVQWSVNGVPPQRGATLLSTVCWAGNVPGRANDLVSVDVAGANGQEAPQVQAPSPEEVQRGAALACSAVSGGS